MELQAQVPPSEAPLSHSIMALAFEVPGAQQSISSPITSTMPASSTHERWALPVPIEVENKNGQLLIGQTGTAIIYTGSTQRIPVVPRDAVLMEAGRPYVFVQIAGEASPGDSSRSPPAIAIALA